VYNIQCLFSIFFANWICVCCESWRIIFSKSGRGLRVSNGHNFALLHRLQRCKVNITSNIMAVQRTLCVTICQTDAIELIVWFTGKDRLVSSSSQCLMQQSSGDIAWKFEVIYKLKYYVSKFMSMRNANVLYCERLVRIYSLELFSKTTKTLSL